MDFKTLIAKLHHFGFSKNVLKWLLSHLSDRKQFVQFDEKISSMLCVYFGVPQGSIVVNGQAMYLQDNVSSDISMLRIFHFMSTPKLNICNYLCFESSNLLIDDAFKS